MSAPGAGGPPIIVASLEAMATTFRIHVAGMPEREARQASAAAFFEIERLERLLSRFVEGSDVDRINRAAAGEWVRVSSDTLDCLALALQAAAATGGAFDPTLGALTRGDAGRAPGGEETGAPSFGFRGLSLDRHGRRVSKASGSLQVDLGGVGKGFALDTALAVLRDWDVPAVLLDSGGSTVLARGPDAGPVRWRARLDSPRESREIPLANASLAGSGTGVKGAHIVDGRTGAPVGLAARCWALAPTAALADALGTAFFVLPWDEVVRLCRDHPGWGAARADAGSASESGIRATGALARLLE